MPVLGRAFSFLPERNNANLPSEQFFSASKRRNPLPICILLPAGFPRSLIRKSLALRTGSYHSAQVFSHKIIPAELVAILSCEQAQKPLANMYTIACGLSAFAHPKISCSEDRFLSFRSGIFPQDNTDGTRCDSFLRASAEIPCQYVNYCLRRFAGTPKQHHPKTFCSRVREAPRPAIPAACEPLISFRVGIPQKQFEYALYDLGRVYTDDLHKSSSIHSLI